MKKAYCDSGIIIEKLFEKAKRKILDKKRVTQLEARYVYVHMNKSISELTDCLKAKQQIIDGLLKELAASK